MTITEAAVRIVASPRSWWGSSRPTSGVGASREGPGGLSSRRQRAGRCGGRTSASASGAGDTLDLSGLRFHDLRHTAGTTTAISGATTKELMARLGHASPQAALRYQHATAERDTAVAAALDRLADAARPVAASSAVVLSVEGGRENPAAYPRPNRGLDGSEEATAEGF